MDEPADEMIGAYQVTRLTGIGLKRLSMMMKAGLFPRRVEASRGRWRKSDVDGWIKDHAFRGAGAQG